MKIKLIQLRKTLGLQIVLLAASSSFCAHGAVTETNSAPTDVARISVFNDDLKTGKDPFFPHSARRAERIPATTEPALAPIVQLSLKGISGPANRRFALINNQPLGVGETAFVRISGGQVKVRCWEIRENSVIVSIEGDPERKELRLRGGL